MNVDFQAADHLMRQAVAQSVFPGAVLLVSAGGEVLLHRAYGMADLFSGRPMTCETVFDLASLTKPLATALGILLLVQQGRLSLDRPCHESWPMFRGGGKERITIRHLLSHCSGLPPWRPYHLLLRGCPPEIRSEAIRRAVAAEPLTAAPGERTAYSDVGYLVLQGVIEHLAGPLDRFLTGCVYRPLSIRDLFFNRPPGGRPLTSFAATELCPLRGRLLIGEVHDDNAHILGGVAGHAGLFGTAGAVRDLLQALISAEAGEAEALFDGTRVRHFFERQSGGTWALGFDTPAETHSSAGRFFPAGSVGHLGYTGTSFWVDRGRGIIVVLLTNRVHPSRYNTAIKTFRPLLHDAVMGALTGGMAGHAETVDAGISTAEP